LKLALLLQPEKDILMSRNMNKTWVADQVILTPITDLKPLPCSSANCRAFHAAAMTIKSTALVNFSIGQREMGFSEASVGITPLTNNVWRP
jgi:hypothetical protein